MSHVNCTRSPQRNPHQPVKTPTFSVTNTRKCTKEVTPTDSHLGPKVGAGKNASSNDRTMFPPADLELQDDESKSEGAEAQRLMDFESWYGVDEEEQQHELLRFSPIPQTVTAVHHDELSITSASESLCGLSTGKVACFREDLVESEQKGTIHAYRKEQDELWVARMQQESSSVVKHWTKRQQALCLALLVAEAHLFQRKKETDPQAPPTATSGATAERPGLAIEDTQLATKLLCDVFLLVDTEEDEDSHYENVRTQLTTLSLWI